jgi:hypothetical protein
MAERPKKVIPGLKASAEAAKKEAYRPRRSRFLKISHTDKRENKAVTILKEPIPNPKVFSEIWRR